MAFAHPLVLLFLIVPVLLGVWEWRRRGHPIVLPLDHRDVVSGGCLRRCVGLFNLTTPAILTVVILMLAGPQRLTVPQRERAISNIQFLMDVSGSMTSKFGDGTRSDAALKAINEFTTYRKGDAFGLTVFGSDILHWVPLTRDLSALRLAAPFLRPEKLPPYLGGTLIAKALRGVKGILSRAAEGDRLIILISDGQSSDVMGGVAEQLGQEFAAERITVYYIHVAEGQPQNECFTIANLTGGQAFAANDPSALQSVFQHIDRMQPAKLKPSAPEYTEWLKPAAILGLAFLSLHGLAAFGLRYTPW